MSGPGAITVAPCGPPSSDYLCSKPFVLSLSLSDPRPANFPLYCNEGGDHPGGIAVLAETTSGKPLYTFGQYAVSVATPHGGWDNDPSSYSCDASQESGPQTIYVRLDEGPVPSRFVLVLTVNGGAVMYIGSSPTIDDWTASTRILVTTGRASPASLAVTLATATPAPSVALGGSTDVTARVTAQGGAVSSISLGKGLISSSGAVSVVPTPARSGFSLPKGASRSFQFAVKGAKLGASLLSLQVAGKSSTGTAVRGSGSLKLRVGGQPLAISIVSKPTPLQLKVNNDGTIQRGVVNATVTIRNTTNGTISGVKLLSLDPEPVDPTQQLNKLGFPAGVFPIGVGSLGPGAKYTRSLALRVTGDGRYQFRALALYDDGSGANGRATAVGGGFEAVVPFLYLTTELHQDGLSDRNGAEWVRGGASWYVGAQIKDLSSYQSLCLEPLYADSSGNAVSTGLQDVSKQAVSFEAPPLAGLLKPGQSFPLGMEVRTSSTGGTNGTVTLTAKAYKALPGASCEVDADGSLTGAGELLTGAETDIKPGATSFTVHVDVSVNPDPSQISSPVLNFFGGFAEGSFAFYGGIAQTIGAVAKWAYNNPDTYMKLVAAFTGDPTAQAELEQRFASHVLELSSLFVNYMEKYVPTTGSNPFAIAAQTWANVGNDAYAKIVKASEGWAQRWTDQVEKDYANGATRSLWRDYAGIAGEGVGQLQAVALQLFAEKTFAQIASEAPELERVAAAETETPATITSSKGGVVPVSRVLNAADLQRGWGITEAVAKKLSAIAEKFDVLIGARSRQAISTKLEELGAIWKNSNFHQKTVNFIDRTYLGMTVDQGLLGFRSFTEDGIAYARKLIYDANDLSASQKLEALQRLQDRIAENGTDFHHIEELVNWEHRACSTCPSQKGWVNAGFNASDSGAAAARTSTSRWRRFYLEETPIRANGQLLGTQYVPYEEAPNLAQLAKNPAAALPELCIRKLGTVLCPITGDIDLVYITNKYGGSLTPEQMYEVFKALDDAGFAHTDLVTWVEQLTNSYYFPGKENQLAGLQLGEEACVQFAPNGQRYATYLAPLQASIAQGPNAYWLGIIGGYFPAMR